MSGANDSQNPFASHSVSSTITRIETSSLSESFWPGADHPGRRQPREIVIGEPAQIPQYLFIVLAQHRRRPHQPVAPTVERRERWPRIAAKAGARMLERFEKPAVIELGVLGHQRWRHHRRSGN